MALKDKISLSPFPVIRVFLIVYLVINLIGIINFPIYFDTIRDSKVFYLFLIGLIAFSFSATFFRVINLNISERELNTNKHNLIKILFIVINIVTAILIVYSNVKNGGIIILSKQDRFKTLIITNLFVYFSIIITLTFYASVLLKNQKMRIKHFLFLLFQALLFLSLGFRSPLVSLLGGFLIVFYTIRNDYQNGYKKIFSVRVAIGLFLFLSLMSTVASLRVSQNYDVIKFYRNINRQVLEDNSFLKPIIPTIALFRYDQKVVEKLIKKKEGDPMYLGLASANILTLLPGKQWAARNIIGDIVGARKKPDGIPWSITPTLQGALFVDGGYIFVAIGFFLAALLMEVMRKYMIKRKNPFIITLYGIVAIALLKCIHTGYVDVPFFIIIGSLFFLKFIVFNISYKKLKRKNPSEST